MIATSKQLRKLVRRNFQHMLRKGNHRSWTDKTTTPEIRRCALMLKSMDEVEAESFLGDLKVCMFLAGYENKMSLWEGYDRSYLRFSAPLKG